MNQYTKLIIDNVEMDLYNAESLPLSITKRVNNLDGDVQGDFSRVSINIPATKRNIAVLGRSRALKPFRIEVDGSPNFSGLAQSKKGKTQGLGYGAIEENYEINLISNNASWFTLLGNVLLKDIVTITTVFDDVNVAAGFTAPTPTPTEGFCFMLIKWKEWNNWTGSYYKISNEEATCGLYIYGILTKAFNSIGWTIESDFFDTDFFGKLVIPTPIPKKLSAEFNEEYLNTKVSMSSPTVFTAGSGNFPFDTIDQAAPQNPTAYNTVSYEYTVPLTGFYQIDLLMAFDSTVPTPPYIFLCEILLNGVLKAPEIGFGFVDSVGNYPTNGIPLRGSGVIKANAGDIITLFWAIISGSPPAPITINTATMTITGEAVREFGMPIDFKYLVKDWRVLDLIKGLKALFNLAFEANDETKVLRIEPKDRYLHTSKYKTNADPTTILETKEGFYKDSKTKDYSKKIDYNKDGSFELEDVEGFFNYKYESDNEETIDWIEGNSKLKIYDATYPIDNGDATKTRPLDVPFFVKTIHVYDIQAKFPDTNVVPQFPLIYPQNYVLDPTASDTDYDTPPRILYHAGRRVFMPDYETQGDGFYDLDGVGQSYVPMTFAVNYGDTTGLDPSLSFGNEEINGNIVSGLTQRFHLRDLARHDKGELRYNYVRFNSIDNKNFSFRLKGIIDSQMYVVQQIEGFNPLVDEPTNFTFYFDVAPTQDNVDKIQSSAIKGIINLLSV